MTIFVKNKHTLQIDEFKFRCCIGKKGSTKNKKEGDKKTPRGTFEIENLYYRRDRMNKPETFLKCFKIKKNIKIFLQINIGNENQKSGINKNEIDQLVSFSKEIGLDVIGLMCIPPANIDPQDYFEEMNKLNKSLGFSELSMGMSSDFLIASKNLATYIRVGSSIFGQRS